MTRPTQRHHPGDDSTPGRVRMTGVPGVTYANPPVNTGPGLVHVGTLASKCTHDENTDTWAFTFTSPHRLALGHRDCRPEWSVDELRDNGERLILSGYGDVTYDRRLPDGRHQYVTPATPNKARTARWLLPER